MKKNGTNFTDAFDKAREYWERKLSGEIKEIDLTCGFPRTAANANEEGIFDFNFPGDIRAGLSASSRGQDVLFYVILLAAFKVLVFKYTGNNDVSIGAPIYITAYEYEDDDTWNRLMVFRDILDRQQGFKNLLVNVKQTVIEGYENQHYVMENSLYIPGFNLPGNPLARVILLLKNIHNRDLIETVIHSSANDLAISFENTSHQLEGSIRYNAACFTPQIIKGMYRHYLFILEQVLANLDIPLSRIELLTGDEKEQILQDFNGTQTAYPGEKLIHELFEEQVEKEPGNTALCFSTGLAGDETLSYRELYRRVEALAGILRGRGISAGTIVALMVDAGPDAAIGLLGILKAGAAYLPIETGAPWRKIAYILEDSSPALLLTRKSAADRNKKAIRRLSPGNIVYIDDPGSKPANKSPVITGNQSHHPAYVIYTSGTSGEPKGVIVEHAGLVNYSCWRLEAYGYTEKDVTLQLLSYSFDGFASNFYSALLSGGELVMVPDAQKLDMEFIKTVMGQKRITNMSLVPGLYDVLLANVEEKEPVSLRFIVLAGEKANPGLIRESQRKLPGVRLINEYGPTETTVTAAANPDIAPAAAAIIGKPIANTVIYILDRFLDLLPAGIPGELFIGGRGVARGYLNNPELTAKKYVRHWPFDAITNRLYRTGDLARWLPGGNIEFLRRIDHQVKIRGLRIELGEIENRLSRHEDIKESIVMATEDDGKEKYLCAYIVPAKEKEIEVSLLREYLSEYLPDYMIPSYFIPIEKVPLTPNGKIDRDALPLPGRMGLGRKYTAPRDSVEEKLAALWAEVLAGEPGVPVGIEDNFFESGGHSLKATILAAKVHRAFGVKVPLEKIFKFPTLGGLSAYIKGAKEERHTAVEPVEKKDYYTLSPAQKRLYILQQMDLESTAYVLHNVVVLEGKLDGDKTGTVFRKLIGRHESFRTSFHMVMDEPVQKIHDNRNYQLQITNYKGKKKRIPEIIDDFLCPFDLSQAPLLRAGLIKLEDERHVLMVDMHHIAADGTSFGILAAEFMAFYGEDVLMPLQIQYKDYAERQDRLIGGKGDRQEEYWLNRFEIEVPALELPLDYNRPMVQSFEGSRIDFSLGTDNFRALKALAREEDATVFMVLLAACNIVLAKLGGQSDIVVGTPVEGRRHENLRPLIGMFVNTLALRNDVRPGMSVKEFLEQVKGRTLEALENQEYPFEELVEKVMVTRDTSRNPLFDVMFGLQNMESPEVDIPGLKLKPYESQTRTTKFDIAFMGMETGEDLVISVEYCTRLFKEETIRRFTTYFNAVVASLPDNPGKKLSEIDILPEEERKRLILDFNDTTYGYPAAKTLGQLFEDRVNKRPDRIAAAGQCLGTGRAAVTYRELDQRSRQLSRLLKEKGVRVDTIAALKVERSIEMLIGIMAILKAGGAYLCLDPDFPEERINYMLNDSGAGILLTFSHLSSRPAHLRWLIHTPGPFKDCPGESFLSLSASLAYLIYTSGSTGRPKGVLVEHGSLINLVYYHRNVFGENRCSRMSQVASMSFDAMAFEVWPCLLSGASLHIAGDETRMNPEAMKAWLIKHQITISFQPTLMAEHLLKEEWPGTGVSLRALRAAGDRLTLYPTQAYPFRFYNLYGPTEDTVWTTWTELLPAPTAARERKYPNIGKPTGNKKVYILGPSSELRPVGAAGELCISGDGLSRGYLNHPELTAEKFIHHFARLYKTGDLARWLPEGNIEFLGRVDFQVKIRGFRIEAGEIENRLLSVESIKQAVVTAREDKKGDKYLCAYIVPDREEVDVPGLREHLSKHLPAYMVPACFIQVEKIPLTPSGKVERKALPEPDIEDAAGFKTYTPPRDDKEKKLAEIWSGVLGLNKEKISADANFFQLGGHSLKATVMISRIHKALNVKLPLVEIFKFPTIRELAKSIGSRAEDEYACIEPAEKRDYYVLSPAQERLYILQQMDLSSTAYNIPRFFAVEGELEVERFEKTFSKLIARHESLRTSFHMIGDQPVQRIHDKIKCKLQISGTIEDFLCPFDLSRAPLLRVGIIKIEDERYIFMVDMHHIASDGVSHGVLIEDFSNIFKGEELSPLRLGYKDYSQWQAGEKQKERIKEQGNYWLKVFEGDVPVLDIAADYPRPGTQSFEGNTLQFGIDEEDADALTGFSREKATTLYMVLSAVFNVLLSKISGQEDIVVGTPVAGRRHADLENIIGMFVNTLALRSFPVGEKTFGEFLAEIETQTLEAFENRDYPFEDLVEQLVMDRDLSRNPLFDIMFSMQDTDMPETGSAEIPGLKLKPYKYEMKTSKFDLSLQAEERGKKLFFSFEYCTQLFKRVTIEKYISYFKQVLSSILKAPGKRLSEIEIMSGEEKKQLLAEFNDTQREYPKEKGIHRLFEEQAVKTPDRIALTGRGHMFITYKELNNQSDQAAGLLRSKGLYPGTIAGITAERSPATLVGILAILKANGAYLPIDPEYPQERIDYMLKDSSAGVLIEKNNRIVVLNSSPLLPLRPFSLAYIIYTSGSTGKPKGVMVEHSSVVNMVLDRIRRYGLSQEDRVLQFSSFTFDASVEQAFIALLGGAVLVLTDKETLLDNIKFEAFMTGQSITHIDTVPTFISNMRWKDSYRLKRIISGGDVCPPALAEKWSRYCDFYNEYGPTETTVVSIEYPVNGSKESTTPLPIGKPLSNTTVYLFDRYMKLVPLGVTGELHIGGAGVSRGYLNNPELTVEKFQISVIPGVKKIYKTGDLARWLPEGNLEYSGRKDRQVKVRGFRIEVEEIESRLLTHDQITGAAVTAVTNEGGEKDLCAYITADREITVPELRRHLSRDLPGYMIPAYFVPLEAFPLTVSGKVNRRALPEPGVSVLPGGTCCAPPRNRIERKLVEIWQKVLGRNTVGIDDNFFQLGGDSIKTIQIVSRMKTAGYNVNMKDIFQKPQISQLAPLVKKVEHIPDQSVVTGIVPLTPIQETFFRSGIGDKNHYNQAVMLFSREGFDEQAVNAAFTKIQEHHDALRMTCKRENGEIVQENHGLDYPFQLEVYNLRNCENAVERLETRANEIQSSICLDKGPLMKGCLFHLDDGDRLLIVVHHLVMDGISWRILFEDLETLFTQYKNREPLVLPLKTDSFKAWAEKLSLYAGTELFLKEKTYWVELEAKQVPAVEKDFAEGENLIKDTKTLSFTLTAEETHALLTQVNDAFGTEINDILLTALGLAVKRIYGHNRLLIALEGHGREEILTGMDVSRTVGWFTSLYPALFDVSYGEADLSRTVKEVKETLRRIPNKGIGHGILKYLTDKTHKQGIDFNLEPVISFNYMGQIDADIEKMSAEIAGESSGRTRSLNDQREYELDVKGLVTGKKLAISIDYSGKQYKTKTIKALLEEYEDRLSRIIDFCSSRETRELTPSDFTYSGLSIEAVDQLQKGYSYLIEDIYPLTPMQEGMLFHALLERDGKDTGIYFEQVSYRLHGKLDISAVEKSINELFHRHDVLRTAFVYEGFKRPLQLVLKGRTVDFYFEDLQESLQAPEDREEFLLEFKKNDIRKRFNLATDVLMRVSVIQTAGSEYEFIWSSHHILMDGWCLGILISEFLEIYGCFLEGNAYRLPTVKPYRNYIQWLEKQDKEQSKKYWQAYLYSYEEVVEIPKMKMPDKGELEYKNEYILFRLDSEITDGLKKMAEQNGVTLNVLIRALWGIILGRYNDKEDVVFGVVVSGRPPELEGVESMVGLFINTIPVRMRYRQKDTFKELLQRVQASALESEPHHYFPLAEIQAESLLKQNLIDHLFIFENFPVAEQIEGYKDKTGNGGSNHGESAPALSNVDIFEQTNYSFNLVISPENPLLIKLHYNGKIYARDFVERIARHLDHGIKQILNGEELTVEQFILLTEEEKKRILYDFNGTKVRYANDKVIHQLFEEQVEKTPDRISILEEGSYSLTYRELNNKSNRLAHLLRRKGVGPDVIVGIMMERSVEMIIGIMGVLKSGGAYLPVDSDSPGKRAKYMLKDSHVDVLLIQGQLPVSDDINSRLDGCCTGDILPVDEDLLGTGMSGFEIQNVNKPDDLAYIIYTSGSTGEPKGVTVMHSNVIRLVNNSDYVDLGEGGRILQTGNLAFDAATFEIWGALLNGLQLVLAGKETLLMPEKLKKVMQNLAITTTWMTSSFFNRMLQADIEIFSALKNLLVGGEVLSPAHINKLKKRYSNLNVINGYGPTENTTFSTTFLIDKEYKENIPIGKPISNSTAYIVDRYDSLQPPGIAGELCVGGEGIARGYLNNPGLTLETFINNPFVPDEKMYRTGDLARWVEDGNIEFLGRRDHQVKIRGFRIELGEIESLLLKHDDIQEAVVLAREEKEDKYLCAYIVLAADAGSLEPSRLREYLAGELPDYMLPSYFVLLEKIPLTPNGKVHQKALPSPVHTPGKEYSAPRDETEKKLAEIWCGLLRGGDAPAPSIGIDDDFFELGGHSLKATTLSALLLKELNVKVALADIFSRPTIRELAAYINKIGKERFVSIPSAEKKEYYRMSSAQKRIYMLQQMDPESTVYNMPAVMEPDKKPDKERIEETLKKLIARHEALRTSFEIVNVEAVQKVHVDTEFEIEYYSTLHRLHRPFDLSRAPLLRVGVMDRGELNHLLMIDMHHIISDGISMEIFFKEFAELYNGKNPSPLRLQYKDYSEWQYKEKRGKSIKRQKEYWSGQFQGEIPRLSLMTDYKRPEIQGFEGKSLTFEIGEDESRSLKALALKEGATLYMILLSIYNVLLFKLSGQEDVIVGTPAAGRGHGDLEQVFGMFVNTLALRNYPRGNESFGAFLADVKTRTIEAFENQDYPFEKLVDDLALNRDAARNPLFDAVFTLQNTQGSRSEPHGLKLKSNDYENKTSKFDLTLMGYEAEKKILFLIEYSTKLFKQETIERFIRYFRNIVFSVIQGRGTGQKIAGIDILSGEERKRLLVDFNDVETVYPGNKTLHRLFEEQAERTPDSVALTGQSAAERHTVSYRELNEKSNRLSSLLRQKGVGADAVTAIMMERCIEMIVGIMGILKAGGAYLPLDPEYPGERIKYMLSDSGARVLVNDEGVNVLNGFTSFKNQTDLSHSYAPGTCLAYIIYTSGTTGKPKGVLTTHRNAIRVVKDTNYIRITRGDRLLQLSNYAFDGSVFDIFGALLNGAALVLMKGKKLPEMDRLSEIIKGEQITVFFVTTALFNTLVDIDIHCFDNIRRVLFGGEMVSVEHTRKALEHLGPGRILHVYGPTETTVYAAFYPINAIEDTWGTIPIGQPIANTALYILDNYGRLVPVGVAGELYIGGDGLARGYLNAPRQSEEKFKVNDAIPGAIYRTGDLVKRLPDGNIVFLGRIDRQVKIRGFRVEPGEIEKYIKSCDKVRDAAVMVIDRQTPGGDGSKYLCAYIVPIPGQEPSVEELKEYLSLSMPDYMIPGFWIIMEKIPLNPNGKVDKKALPLPDVEIAASNKYSAPRDKWEKILTEIWSEVLGIDRNRIGIDTDFFDSGGHSLKATQMVVKIQKRLDVKLPLADVFRNHTIRGLSKRLKGLVEDKYIAIGLVEKREYYTLSSAQKRLYLLQQMDAGGTVYNMPNVLIIEENIDIKTLEDTFKRLISRHESLRTSFELIDEEPVQKVHDDVGFKVLYDEVQEKAVEKILEDFVRPFDLCRAPLFRAAMLKVESSYCLLFLDMHHIITDGASQAVLTKEFTRLYNGDELSPLILQYKDYSQWQQHQAAAGAFTQQEEYWLQEFEGEIPVLNIPFDYPKPTVQSFEGDLIDFELTGEEVKALKEIARLGDATLFMVLLAVYNIFLSKISGQEDVVVGTPVAGRRHPDLEGIIGMFVNTLALRNDPSGKKTFVTFLNQVKEKTLAAFENQDYQFEDLVEKAAVKRDIGRNPLFDVMLNVEDILSGPGDDVEGGSTKSYPLKNRTSKFDLMLNAIEIKEKLVLSFQYCTKLFKKETLLGFIKYFKQIAASIIKTPGREISRIEIISEEEKNRILYDFNDTKVRYARDKVIHRLFEEQAEKTPDRIALLEAAPHSLTYRELNERTNRLAQLLRRRGVGPGAIVGIMMERSVEMIVGIIGVLKSGCAYLPVDSDSPGKRIKYMLEDSDVDVLLTQEPLPGGDENGNRLGGWSSGEILPLDKDLFGAEISEVEIQNMNRPDDLAYVIYTSGSTGEPKGVMVEHRNVIRLVNNSDYVELKEDGRILQTGALAFDASTFEIWGALLNGMQLVLAGKETLLMPETLKKVMQNMAITTTWMTSSFFNRMLQADIEIFSKLKNLLVGGEVLSPAHINKLKNRYPHLNVINGYGPTENTTFSTTFLIDKEYKESIPIGKPITNSSAYIIDKYFNLQPVGIAGELYVGGDGVSRGYLNNPELTAEKFIHPSMFIIHPLYRTGDLVRWLPDGNIEFLSRIDYQVKIRGFRIEAGEIEAQLQRHEKIKNAIVLAVEDATGEKSLAAYFVSDKTLDISGLREYLAARLPNYMLPAYFMQVGNIPLTPNGKVDKRSLPAPAHLLPGEGNTGPRDEIEKKLVDLWSDVLGIGKEKIGIDADFFQLGGHSLKATTLTAKIHKEFNVLLPLADMFANPTVREIAANIKTASKDKYQSIRLVEEKDYYPLSSPQKRMYLLQDMLPSTTAYNISTFVELEGKLDMENLGNTFYRLIQHHENLRTSFPVVEKQPVQKINRDCDFNPVNYRTDDGKTLETIAAEFVRPFDLTQAPLIRVGIVRLSLDRHLLMVDMHHIISDGSSQRILMQDFTFLYMGMENKLPRLKLRYKDYSRWQQNRASGETGEWMKQQEKYWLKQFEGDVPVLNMPVDYIEPPRGNLRGDSVQFEIDSRLTAKIRKMVSDTETTLYMVLLASFNILLSKYTGQEDIVIASVIAGRNHADLENIIGMFVNMLAMRNRPGENLAFDDFLEEVKENTLNAFKNQDYPFEELVMKLGIPGKYAENPLLEACLILQNIEGPIGTLPGLKPTPYDFKNRESQFNLNMVAAEGEASISVILEYAATVYKRATIEDTAKHYIEVLEQIVEDKHIKLKDIRIFHNLSRSQSNYKQGEYNAFNF